MVHLSRPTENVLARRRKEANEVARLDYNTAYLVVRAIIALRIVLFASSVTGLGVLMNTYRPPATVATVMQVSGQLFLGSIPAQKPNAFLVLLAVVVVGIIVAIVIGTDLLLSRLLRAYIRAGVLIESRLESKLKLFSILVENDNQLKTIFMCALSVVGCVAMLWVINFLVGIFT